MLEYSLGYVCICVRVCLCERRDRSEIKVGRAPCEVYILICCGV